MDETRLIRPLETKQSANPDRREIRKFPVLEKASQEQGPGGIICMDEEVMLIDANHCFIPCGLI